MDNLHSPSELFETSRKSAPGFSIDFKRILGRALQFWYLIVLSTLAGLSIAFLINRYTTRIYPITTSIIIREPAENTDARFLYNNALVNAYRNYYNEPYIIRSYPLIQGVIEELQFHIAVYKDGNFKSSEQYGFPAMLQVLEGSQSNISLRILSSNVLECSSGEATRIQFAWGDTVKCGGLSFKLMPTGDISKVIGEQFVVRVMNPEDIAGQYINRLKVSWAQQHSSVVNLDINGPIAQKEVDFLATLIRHYQQYDLEKKSQAASRSLSFIEAQLRQIGDSLKLYENSLELFKQQNFVTDLSAEAQQLYEQLKVLSEQRAHVLFARNYYDYLRDYLKKNADFSHIIIPTSIGVSDGILNSLVSRLVTLQSELSVRPNNLNPLFGNETKKIAEGITEVRQQILEALSNLEQTDRIRATGIDQQIKRIENQLRTLPMTERRLVNIKRNYTFSENM